MAERHARPRIEARAPESIFAEITPRQGDKRKDTIQLADFLVGGTRFELVAPAV